MFEPLYHTWFGGFLVNFILGAAWVLGAALMIVLTACMAYFTYGASMLLWAWLSLHGLAGLLSSAHGLPSYNSFLTWMAPSTMKNVSCEVHWTMCRRKAPYSPSTPTASCVLASP